MIVCNLVSAFPFVAGVASSPLNGGSMVQWEERVFGFLLLEPLKSVFLCVFKLPLPALAPTPSGTHTHSGQSGVKLAKD